MRLLVCPGSREDSKANDKLPQCGYPQGNGGPAYSNQPLVIEKRFSDTENCSTRIVQGESLGERTTPPMRAEELLDNGFGAEEQNEAWGCLRKAGDAFPCELGNLKKTWKKFRDFQKLQTLWNAHRLNFTFCVCLSCSAFHTPADLRSLSREPSRQKADRMFKNV